MKKHFYLTKSQIDVVLRALDVATAHKADQLARFPRCATYDSGRAYVESELRDMRDLQSMLYEFLLKR